MPSAQYRPLDTGVATSRPGQSVGLRGVHGGKVRALWPKTANSRRVFVCVMILMMLLVYVVWCAVVNYTDDGRAGGSYATTTGKLHSTTNITTPRSKGKALGHHHYGYLVAVGAPLMLQKLKQQQAKVEINDFLNSSLIGLNITTLSPTTSDMQRLPNILDNKLGNELPAAPCAESFLDSRVYVQDKARLEWDNLTTIYFVTPTYPRREQVPELTRLAYTLLNVPRIHWIVANDHNACNPYLNNLLNKFGIPFTHLASPMPERFRKAASKPRGVANRRAAMQWLRQRNITTGVLYFGDDDNTYDLKLFSEIRDTKYVSMFPVGLIADYGISGPVVRKGKVIGFLDSWVAGRRWPVDMAGFAVNLAYMSEYPNASMPFKPGYEEDYFLRSIALTLDKIEPKGNNCTEILVWHTQTKNHNRTTVKLSHEYLDDRSNLGALFKALTEMGVSGTSDDEGQKAIISKNGKAKAIGYFLS